MMRLKVFAFCLVPVLLAIVDTAEAGSPTLDLSILAPATLRFSWPSNFTDWQLISTPNLSSANWQPVLQAPVVSGHSLIVLYPITNTSGFFRLEQTGTGCTFQATPPVIMPGGSSTLTWCPVPGTTYRLSPGPGIVTGGSLPVSPAVTTVYTLTASNASGVVTNFATVTVSSCAFANVTNWDAALNFDYQLAPSAAGYAFHVHRSARTTFHLTRSSGPGGDTIFTFNGSAAGTVSIEDREDDSSGGSLITTTMVGAGPPVPLLSTFVLSVNCAANTYNFAAIVAVDGIETITSNGISSSSRRTAIAGQVAVFPLALPTSGTTLSGSGLLPAVGFFSLPTTDYYTPNDSIANDMWIYGVITDATAGKANVSWSFSPSP